MKYIMCSRHFPKGHPKAGRPTYFVEKILLGLLQAEEITIGRCIELARHVFNKDHPVCSYNAIRTYDCRSFKHHTIRPNSRFKPGDMASLRVWSGAPYRSKQIEFAQVEVKKVWRVEIGEFWWIDNNILEHNQVVELAKNDGLIYDDFVSWFNIHPKKKEQVFRGQIIAWSNEINYDIC